MEFVKYQPSGHVFSVHPPHHLCSCILCPFATDPAIGSLGKCWTSILGAAIISIALFQDMNHSSLHSTSTETSSSNRKFVYVLLIVVLVAIVSALISYIYSFYCSLPEVTSTETVPPHPIAKSSGATGGQLPPKEPIIKSKQCKATESSSQKKPSSGGSKSINPMDKVNHKPIQGEVP